MFRKFFGKYSSPVLQGRKSSQRAFPWFAGGALCALVSFGVVACISDGGGRRGDAGDGVKVELQLVTTALAKAAVGAAARPVDSVHVQVSGSGMDTVRLGFGGASQSLSILDLSPGANRRFDVRLFHGGKLLYSGTLTTELFAGRANNVSINCLPEFSRVSASIHIPTDFPKTVAGGEMRLWNGDGILTASQSVNGELRNFRLEEVPGDRDYAVSIALWDAQGDTLAKAYKSDLHVPKGQNVALVLPLTLTFSQLALTMTVGDPRTTSLVLTLPGGKRVPSIFGDAVFSELYPVPTTEEGGDNGEWVELFNRVADTLDVSGCQILRDAGTSSGMNVVLPAGTMIAPGRALVVGRSAVAFAQVTQASALTLTNTSARLEFTCAAVATGGARIDTVRYSSSASDTVSARIASAKIATLKPSRLAGSHAADAWCQSVLNPAGAEFAATPGGIEGGCGE
jgi:hypothetical protein